MTLGKPHWFQRITFSPEHWRLMNRYINWDRFYQDDGAVIQNPSGDYVLVIKTDQPGESVTP